jgi:hypothetical protein
VEDDLARRLEVLDEEVEVEQRQRTGGRTEVRHPALAVPRHREDGDPHRHELSPEQHVDLDEGEHQAPRPHDDEPRGQGVVAALGQGQSRQHDDEGGGGRRTVRLPRGEGHPQLGEADRDDRDGERHVEDPVSPGVHEPTLGPGGRRPLSPEVVRSVNFG